MVNADLTQTNTYRKWKKTHPKGTPEQWLESRTDRRKANVPKGKLRLDSVSELYANKKRI